MTESQHSPLPWRQGNFRENIEDAGGRTVLTGVGPYKLNNPFVITAVNTHATLLAAAKRVIDNLPTLFVERHPAVVALKDAIAKAEEASP